MPEDRKPEPQEEPKAVLSFSTKPEEEAPEPKPEPKPLTRAQVQGIVHRELEKVGWMHDAAHGTTEGRMAAQRARDEEAELALDEEPTEPTGI